MNRILISENNLADVADTDSARELLDTHKVTEVYTREEIDGYSLDDTRVNSNAISPYYLSEKDLGYWIVFDSIEPCYVILDPALEVGFGFHTTNIGGGFVGVHKEGELIIGAQTVGDTEGYFTTVKIAAGTWQTSERGGGGPIGSPPNV